VDTDLTFDDYVRMEPRLGVLMDRARAIAERADSERFCANEEWYCELKPALIELVGFDADRRDMWPLLSSPQAYDLCYDTVLAALPDCRGCACL
jgi:hypothetical protein